MDTVNDHDDRLRRAKARYRAAALAFMTGNLDAVRMIDQAQDELDRALAEQPAQVAAP